MHIVDYQYLRGCNIKNIDISMHDLKRIYYVFLKTLTDYAKQNFSFGGNSQFYPKPPLFTDIELVSLAITAESLQIDSENYLWSKLKTDYRSEFPNLPHRTKFNARKKRLTDLIAQCMVSMRSPLVKESDMLIIDSVPIPVCRMAREQITTVCQRKEDEVRANKTYNPSHKQWYIGYKLHLIITESGVYMDMLLTPASEPDICFLKELNADDYHLFGRTMLGDRGYIGQVVQLNLFEQLHLDLKIPYRRNQKDFTAYPWQLKIKRKTIETVFSQLCDEFMLKRNYAKSYKGLFARVITKLAAKTFKQLWNNLNNNPINQTKHALVA